MRAFIQTVKKFHEETGMDTKLIRKLMDRGDIPEIMKDVSGGTRYIDMIEFYARVENQQFRIRNEISLVKKSDK